MSIDIDFGEVERLVADGYIGKQAHPDGGLWIYNYTAKATYESFWCEETEICRGLIVDADYQIVALPLRKFWNLGEGGRWPTAPLVEVTEKWDGSLGILYRHPDGYRIATRGNFTSAQALWATAFLRRNYDLAGLPEHYTLLFEIVYPGNRIVVDYGQHEDLVLIGVRDRESGHDFWQTESKPIAERHGFRVPGYHNQPLEDLLSRARTLPVDREGWVLRFVDGSRFKIKGERYLELQRFLLQLTPQRVHEAVAEGRIDDLLRAAPEEYRPQILEWQQDFNARAEQIRLEVEAHFARATTGDRKQFALWVQREAPKPLQFLLYLRYEARDLRPQICRALVQGKL